MMKKWGVFRVSPLLVTHRNGLSILLDIPPFFLSRSAVQSATGILSGSVYKARVAFGRNLYGELESWKSNRTTLIKNHDTGARSSEKFQVHTCFFVMI